MKKLHKQEIEIPFEVGQTYITKFATAEKFTITRLGSVNKKDEMLVVYGVYDKASHLGECPISVERLISKKEYTGVEFEVTVCPKCKHEF